MSPWTTPTGWSPNPVETQQAAAASTPSFNSNLSLVDTQVDMSGAASAGQTSDADGSSITVDETAAVSGDLSQCADQPLPCMAENQGLTDFTGGILHQRGHDLHAQRLDRGGPGRRLQKYFGGLVCDYRAGRTAPDPQSASVQRRERSATDERAAVRGMLRHRSRGLCQSGRDVGRQCDRDLQHESESLALRVRA